MHEKIFTVNHVLSASEDILKVRESLVIAFFFVPNKNLVENSCENNRGLDTAYYRELTLKVINQFINGILQNKIVTIEV